MRLWGLLAVAAVAVSADPDQLNPIYPSTSYRRQFGKVANGVGYLITAPDTNPFKEVHLFGDAAQRGEAQGRLLGDEIYDFVINKLEDYYRAQVNEIPLTGLPDWLADAIRKAGRELAPIVFDMALGWVYEQQKVYINASAANIWTEIDAMATGVCFNRTGCDVAKMADTLRKVNMLPELIKMQCSMMGVQSPGSLVQMRTLDFGGGPFANRSFLVVHHPPAPALAFASLSFYGFAGAVTGFNEKVGLCEKVNDVSGGPNPPGTYDGQAVSMVIRDIIQFATTKEEAVGIMHKAKRTWGVWLGVGDIDSKQFLAVSYSQQEAAPFDYQTLPLMTSQPRFNGVAYIDKHAQPSRAPDLPSLIQRFYGNLTAINVVQNVPRLTKSGDVHIAIYDFANGKTYIANGVTDENGKYIRLACDSPFLEFDTAKLWGERL